MVSIYIMPEGFKFPIKWTAPESFLDHRVSILEFGELGIGNLAKSYILVKYYYGIQLRFLTCFVL